MSPGLTGPGPTISIVVPTLGRPSLARLLNALAEQVGQLPVPERRQLASDHHLPSDDRPATEIILVDDRPDTGGTLPVPAVPGASVAVLPGRAAGPAAARNVGWRAAHHPWVVFLDDDVVPAPDWWDRLRADLDVPEWVGGVQGRVSVPLPLDRRPTDWERTTAGLAHGRWITADMAYRRVALATVAGFDERFPRAYREDAELAHRVRLAGWRLVRGSRDVTHPVRQESRWVSLRTQRGNADDALLRRLYGPRWRDDLDLPSGRRHRHAVVTAAALVAATATGVRLATPHGAALGRTTPHRTALNRTTPHRTALNRTTPHRTAPTRRWWRSVLAATSVTAAAGWFVGTGRFAWERVAPGPSDPAEIGAMLVTSVLIPPLAIGHWLRGWWRWRASTGPARPPATPVRPP